MTSTLPRGIALSPAGNYRVRLKRGSTWSLGGTFEVLGDAVAALHALEARLPARTLRTPLHASWKAEQARQRAELPGADLTGIYASQSGWTVKLIRDQITNYLGHYATLAEALARRDEGVNDLGAVPRRKAKVKAPPKKRGRKAVPQDPALECPALL